MAGLSYKDQFIRQILWDAKTIAMVGCSANWSRPSNFAMKYLLGKGYRVIPVNPRYAGEEIWGERVYASLRNVPGKIELVDIFRPSKEAGWVTDQTLEIAREKGISVIWMQLGIRNDDAARRAQTAGLRVVMDRCLKIEYGRLHGELSWSGVNTGIISAKRARLRA